LTAELAAQDADVASLRARLATAVDLAAGAQAELAEAAAALADAQVRPI